MIARFVLILACVIGASWILDDGTLLVFGTAGAFAGLAVVHARPR